MSMCVYLFVCPSACTTRISRKPQGRPLRNFLCMLPVAVARSSTDGVAMRHVIPVLWMTSCFHMTVPMGQNRARLYYV